MVEKIVTVTNNTGLHARPAADFVKIATGCPCEVYLEKNGKKVNAKSILGVLSLAISKGTEINIITEGTDEMEVLDQLVTFVENLED